jgi:hypothetical protein
VYKACCTNDLICSIAINIESAALAAYLKGEWPSVQPVERPGDLGINQVDFYSATLR